MELKTNKGELFIIDDEDYDLIKEITWYHNNGYIKGYRKDNGKAIYLHRLIMGVHNYKLPMIDHKNKNGLDNRKINLRKCTNSENQKNKKSRGSSKYLGVTVHSTTRKYINKKGIERIYVSKPVFLTKISIDGKQKNIGVFKTEIDAAKAYDEAAKIHHGEFANLNIV